MLANCDVIVIILIYGQFGAIWKPDSGRIACKTYIFINSNFYLTKTENRAKKISNTALTLLLWVEALFLPTIADFSHFYIKNPDISKTKNALILKRYVFWNCICLSTYVPNFKFLA